MKNKADINNDRSFWIRFRSSTILMIITIGSMLLGGYVLFGVLTVVSLIGLMELYRVVGVNKKGAGIVGYIFGALLFASLLSFSFGTGEGAFVFGLENPVLFPVMVGAFLIILLAVYVLTFPKYNSEQITMVFFGFFYVALTMSYIYRVRTGDCGAYAVWLIFIGSWGSDTMAYLVGRTFGKHKIAPVLSPKKSLEGCIGGVVGAALIGFVYSMIFKDNLMESFSSPVLLFTVVSAVSGIVSMIGDMAASAIKRNKNIKDYGRLIPGHGGILDRFDSVIFIAPIIYYLLIIFG